MSFSEFANVRLGAVAAVVPREEVRLEDELAYYNNDIRKVERIRKMAGLDRRRIAPEGVTVSDLCVQAAERLLAETGTDRAGIDALVCVTQAGDYPMPASAFLQQKALGLSTDCAVFDVNLGCSGYVYGLWLAACMIASGARRRVLLTVGEAYFRYLDPANRIVAPIFGDAGTASLLEYAEGAAPLSFSLGSDGSGFEALVRPGGGASIPHLPDARESDAYLAVVRDAGGNPWSVGGFGNTWMDGEAIFEFTMSVVPEHIRAHLDHCGLVPEDLDFLVLHQANGQIVQNLAAAAGFPPGRAPWATFAKYGNQAGASIPCVICDQFKERCEARQRLHLALCGFGIGLSWGSCVGDFTGLHCCGIHDFTAPASPASRAERIAYWHRKFAGESDG
ncbi:MAG: ketoacyl-ACP synthase III [Desulfovibrio sp.]|jgi:3-oxoacyl-[acyl-carrier-protein] synthase-3|nr:ketoacyl-ACP synthase III [Desulfovibrio sp.]